MDTALKSIARRKNAPPVFKAALAALLLLVAGIPAGAGAADRKAPTVAITAPGAGAIVSGTINITASAWDNVGVASVRFRLDGVTLGALDTAAPYSILWDTTGVTNGTHTLVATARDAAGNSRQSAPVTVTVANGSPSDTTPPVVSVTSPAAGAIVTGTITVTASASDSAGIAGVQFKYDGSNLGPEDTSAPYSVVIDTATGTNGTHVLTAVARDAAGNLSTSAPVTVTFSNGPVPFTGTPISIPGTFEAENFDLGGEGIAYHDTTAGNAGGEYRPNVDVDLFLSNDSWGGGYIVKNFTTGEWLAYTISVPASGNYDIELRAATNFDFPNAAFHIEIDGVDVTGTVVLPDTGGWNSYQWVGKRTIALAAGTRVLKVFSDQPYFGFNAIRVSAVPAPDPEPDPSSVLFLCTFLIAPTDCGFGEQAKVPGRASIVNVARDGLTSVRLHTEPGDTNVAGSGENERNDLTLSQAASGGFEGAEWWYANSILFPFDYVDPPMSTETTWNWGVVFDFHNTTSGAGQANFQINAWPATALYSDRPTGLGFQVAYGSQTNPTVYRVPIGPVVRNVWYDFVYHIKWTSNTDGFITAWLNGVKKMDYRGPTLYAGQGVYMKLANYHSPFGQASSVIHDRVIRGTTPAAVSLTPLEGILP